MSHVLEQNGWKLAALRIIRGSLTLAVPTIVGYWQAHGLSLSEVMVLQAAFAIAVVTLEVPSGYLADVLGRKRSIVLGMGATVFGEWGYVIADGFYGFLAAEILLAVGLSLVSGADLALLFDSLYFAGKVETHQRYLNWMVSREMYAFAAFAFCGGVLALGGPSWPFIGAGILSVFGVAVAGTLVEPPRLSRGRSETHLRQLAGICYWSLVEERTVRRLLIRSAFLFSALQGGLWFYQPYLMEEGVRAEFLGVVFALFSLVAGLSARNAHRVSAVITGREGTHVLWYVLSLGYLLMASGGGLFSVAFILVHQVVRGVSAVLYTDELNRAIDSQFRATVLSLRNMGDRVLYAVVLVLMGQIADLASISAAFAVIAFATIVIGLRERLEFRKRVG